MLVTQSITSSFCLVFNNRALCLPYIHPLPHAHLLAHLVSEAFLPITQLLPILLPRFVSTVRAVGEIKVVPFFLGPVLTVTFAPLGLVLSTHEFIELVVVPLPFPVFVFPSVIFISRSASMLLSLLFVALRLTPSGHKWEWRDKEKLFFNEFLLFEGAVVTSIFWKYFV